MRTAILLSLSIVVALGACGGGDEEPPLAALHEGASMRDTPWPSDAFLREGRLAVGPDLPLEGEPGALAKLAEALSDRDGAPTTGSAFFPASGEAPEGPLEGSAEWIDLDEAARVVATGRLFYRASTREIVALAPPAVPLTPGHRHAVIVSSPKVHPSPAMRDALEGRGPYASLFAAAAPALAGRTISAMTVFTVGTPSRTLDAMAEVALAEPIPKLTIDRVVLGDELDALLGTPTTKRSGLGDGKGLVHDALGAVVLGSYETAGFLSERPRALGRVAFDASGAPRVRRRERVTFMLALPKRPAKGWADVPLAIFQHGLNAGRAQVAAVANDYARRGFATFGVDALWHGDRAQKTKDEVHNFTGAAGPDGLADADDFGAAIKLFDFEGDREQGIEPFEARVVRDNFLQAEVDLVVSARVIRRSDLSPIAAAAPELAGLSLSAERLMYTGESFGSIVGACALAASPDLAGATFAVGGGGIFSQIIPQSPYFGGLVTTFLRRSFDRSLDLELGDVLPGEAQRSIALIQAAIEPSDPLTCAPLWAARKKDALLLMARHDELIPNPATELLALAGGATAVALPSRSEPPRHVTLPAATAPFADASGSTRALVQLSPATHVMFTAFADSRRYDTDRTPVEPLPSEIPVDNPTELAHELAASFAASLRSGGAGRVEALPR